MCVVSVFITRTVSAFGSKRELPNRMPPQTPSLEAVAVLNIALLLHQGNKARPTVPPLASGYAGSASASRIQGQDVFKRSFVPMFKFLL